ncbi:MAG TPA: hypothetical protein VKH37_12770, partial [Ferruginibacter sp.]|nr:hypothetical protein [Ferruginibacter sp.]
MNAKKISFLLFALLVGGRIFAETDTVRVPIERQLFHEKISEEQTKLDRYDGRADGIISVGMNTEINNSVTATMTQGIKALTDSIEVNFRIPKNQEKIRYLRNIENLLKNFRLGLKYRTFNPTYAQALVDGFEKAMDANIDGLSIAPSIEALPYDAAKLISDLFTDNIGYRDCKKILFLKFSEKNPDQILTYIEPYVGEPFADSLIVACAKYNPTSVYNAAQAPNSKIGKLIHSSTNPLVMEIVEISKTPNALMYFPFMDDLIKGKKTVADIKKYVGDDMKNYDSVGYFKLLVQTEIEYFKRLSGPAKDTPVAMFGANGLRQTLQEMALHHFITPINELHDQSNLNIRMRSTDQLSSVDLYYMIVMGENEIYTSSYKHSFSRLLARLGPNAKTDSLLLTVHFDYFKKFIKMAASFNTLDDFLKLMPRQKSQMLMRAFVGNLDQANSMEDAVDVADSYSSITDKKLLKTILGHVIDYENLAIQNNDDRGKKVYGLLKMIF